jgi:hypothetical protein
MFPRELRELKCGFGEKELIFYVMIRLNICFVSSAENVFLNPGTYQTTDTKVDASAPDGCVALVCTLDHDLETGFRTFGNEIVRPGPMYVCLE